MKIVKLIHESPFSFRGSITWFQINHEFEVLEEKILPEFGLFYRLKDLKYNVILDGLSNSNDFEVIKNV